MEALRREQAKAATAVFRARRQGQYQKTRPCRFFERGMCVNEDNCKFAHGDHELRESLDLKKTAKCPLMSECREVNCKFAHTITELRSTHDFFKTKMCRFYEPQEDLSLCLLGDSCRFAHSAKELAEIQCEPLKSCIIDHGYISGGDSDDEGARGRSGKDYETEKDDTGADRLCEISEYFAAKYNISPVSDCSTREPRSTRERNSRAIREKIPVRAFPISSAESVQQSMDRMTTYDTDGRSTQFDSVFEPMKVSCGCTYFEEEEDESRIPFRCSYCD